MSKKYKYFKRNSNENSKETTKSFKNNQDFEFLDEMRKIMKEFFCYIENWTVDFKDLIYKQKLLQQEKVEFFALI